MAHDRFDIAPQRSSRADSRGSPAHRRHRIAAIGLLAGAVAVLAVARAPAVLLDSALAQATAGRVRLAQAEGTLWHGQARLSVTDRNAAISPLSQLRWQLQPAALAGLRLRWRLTIDDAAPTSLSLGPDGLQVAHLAIELPPAAALAAVPHGLARAGWRGVLALQVPTLHCDWQPRCHGTVNAQWRAGGVDILPGQAFGDHALRAELSPQGATVTVWNVRKGELGVEGEARFSHGRPPRLSLDIDGDVLLISRLREMLSEAGAAQEGARLRIRR